MGAIAALIHDVLITVGIFSLLGKEFNLPIIAALVAVLLVVVVVAGTVTVVDGNSVVGAAAAVVDVAADSGGASVGRPACAAANT